MLDAVIFCLRVIHKELVKKNNCEIDSLHVKI